MRSLRHLSIRSHLILLVAAVLLPVLLFAGFIFWQHVELQRATVERGMRDTARAMSLALDREIGQIRAIAETLASSLTLEAKDFSTFHALSSRAVRERKGSWVVLLDRSGQQITNTLRPFGSVLPNTLQEARGAEKALAPGQGTPESVSQVLKTGKPVITDLFIGLVSGRPSVSVNVPVMQSGEVAYVLTIGIYAEGLVPLLVGGELPPDWYAAIIDRRGITVARYPDPEEMIGRRAPKTMRAHGGRLREGWGEDKNLNGVDVYRAFFRSDLSGWTVAIGAPQALVDGPVNRVLIILAFGAAILALFALAAAVFLGKRISVPVLRLAKFVDKFQSGKPADVDASGITEIAKVHAALGQALAERQKLEDDLRQAQKLEAIGTLAGGIAHDFNNSLNIVQAYATLIREQPSNPERIKEAASVIHEEVQRSASVVRQLMTIARKTEISLTPTDLNQIVRTVANLAKQTFPRTIEIRLKLNEGLEPVLADPNQITQAILNICLNARDAMSQGGELTLATDLVESDADASWQSELAEGRHVCIAVTDTGPGMEENVRQKALEPFFTTKPVGEGTGLGLAMAFGIMKNHHGALHIQSQLGAGTTVRLYLPAPDAEKAQLPSPRAPKPRLLPRTASRGTILIAEDEPSMIYLLEGGLMRAGFRVLASVDGARAIELYRCHRSEVALSVVDLGLPKVSGIEVIRAIKALNPAAKIIVTTGYIQPEVKSEAFQAGISDFIEKPYDVTEIVEAILRQLTTEAPQPRSMAH